MQVVHPGVHGEIHQGDEYRDDEHEDRYAHLRRDDAPQQCDEQTGADHDEGGRQPEPQEQRNKMARQQQPKDGKNQPQAQRVQQDNLTEGHQFSRHVFRRTGLFLSVDISFVKEPWP